jgi:hypothetical protein
MTFSAMERYVRICETVFKSDAMLSAGDRLEIAQDLIEAPGNPSVEYIEQVCARVSDQRSGEHMINAQILRENRGYRY